MTKKFAFTLAEVLITLAIIGVVAVITIPTMVAGNKEKAWNTAATVFEKRLNETLKVMNVEGKLEGYTSTKDFVNALSSQLKITKTCDNSNLTSCFSDKVFWGGGDATPEEVDISTVKMAKNFGQKDWGTEIVGFQLNNGTNGLIAYNPDCEVDKFDTNADATSCVAVLYDTTGFAQPNTSGKDLRGINVLSLGGKDCAFEIGGTCYGTPFQPTAHFWKGCDYAGTTTDSDDLAFMSKYGITYCIQSVNSIYGDSWAGAVEACGGVNKMPTELQLREIANYVYNTDSITSGYQSNLTLDTDKISSLGFVLSSSTLHVWSGVEHNAKFAEGQLFGNTYTEYDDDYFNRYNTGDFFWAVCIQ